MALARFFYGSTRILAGRVSIALMAALFVGSASTSALAAEESKTGDLEVTVVGLETERGSLIVALLNSEVSFEDDGEPFRSASVSPKAGKGTVTFRGIPYGSYAVKTFHDENSNEKLDTNFVGFPKEGFGFSNDAMGRFGPPSYEQARFEVAAGTVSIEISTN